MKKPKIKGAGLKGWEVGVARLGDEIEIEHRRKRKGCQGPSQQPFQILEQSGLKRDQRCRVAIGKVGDDSASTLPIRPVDLELGSTRMRPRNPL